MERRKVEIKREIFAHTVGSGFFNEIYTEDEVFYYQSVAAFPAVDYFQEHLHAGSAEKLQDIQFRIGIDRRSGLIDLHYVGFYLQIESKVRSYAFQRVENNVHGKTFVAEQSSQKIAEIERSDIFGRGSVVFSLGSEHESSFHKEFDIGSPFFVYYRIFAFVDDEVEFIGQTELRILYFYGQIEQIFQSEVELDQVFSESGNSEFGGINVEIFFDIESESRSQRVDRSAGNFQHQHIRTFLGGNGKYDFSGNDVGDIGVSGFDIGVACAGNVGSSSSEKFAPVYSERFA